MGLRINTNVQSLIAQHRLDATRHSLEHTQNKLSSGSRIIKAMDDAAGLAISESLRATIRSTDKNILNANDGMYLMETAESALKEITDIVIRMKELTIQAASDTIGDKERGYLQSEVNSITSELNRISNATVFNGRELINGNAGAEVQVQVGPNNNEDVDRIKLNFDFAISSDNLGIAGVDITNATGARDAIDLYSNALEKLSFIRGQLGASEASLQSTIRNLMSYKENVTGAFSQIRDADVAHETAEAAKFNIMTQAGVAVLSQANAAPQIALKLLQ